jgi:purine-binding chemotaxis protein CheW
MKVKEHAIGEDTGGEEYLAFTLGREEYGIDILKVQEIRGYETVTRIANAPDFIKGVINLRGIIVPIVDLRIKFQLDRVEYNQYTVVIILNLTDRVVGIVVDGVSDYIRGLGSIDERMLILVDIEQLLMSADMALCDEAEAA